MAVANRQTETDISNVLRIERKVFSGPLWFSYQDGTFDFTRSFEEAVDLEIATALVQQHYALAFLQTLGNVIALE